MRFKLGGREYRRLVDVCDELLTPIVMIVLVIGLLQTIPQLVVFMTSIIGSTVSFCFGLIFGILSAFVFLIVGFFLITKKVVDEPPVKTEKKKELISKTRKKGSFSAAVWIVSTSKWSLHKPLRKFPPADVGDGYEKGLIKYHASVKKGYLTLSSLDVANQWRVVLRIDLEGCSCRVVKESINSRSLWWKKAPIEISHPERVLYDGDCSLLMFCSHGADKEQWMIQLCRHMSDGDRIDELKRIFRQYSKKCRQSTSCLRSKSSTNSKTASKMADERGGLSGRRGSWFPGWRTPPHQARLNPQSNSSGSEPCLQGMEIAAALDEGWSGEIPKTKKQGGNHHRHHHHSMNSMNKKNGKQNLSHEAKTLNFDYNRRLPSQEDLRSSSSFCRSGFSDEEIKTEDGIHGLNLFLARWSFDAMRNPDFKKKFHEFILKKLRSLRRPDFITELNVSKLELGTNFPEIKSVRSLPSEEDSICPQLLIDVDYDGGLEFTVETIADPREGSAWETLDKALNAWKGAHLKTQQTEEASVELPDDGSDLGEEFSEDNESKKKENIISTPERPLSNVFPLKKITAFGAKQLASRVVESIPKISLGLSVKVLNLEGTMLVWVSPPPASRLWISFLNNPKLEIHAKPIFANRFMKYSAHLVRVSSWLEGKIRASFLHNLVYPNCIDLTFPGLLGLTDICGLKHPENLAMDDLQGTSECESEESELYTPSPSAAPSTTKKAEVKLPSEEKELPTELSKDERLSSLRRGRYDPHRYSSFRRTWEGQDLHKEREIPTKQTHGRVVIKRCRSFSDGDVSDIHCEDLDQEKNSSLEVSCVMSDCTEFFDPEVTSPSSKDQPDLEIEKSVHSVTTPIKWPQRLPSSSSEKILVRRRSGKINSEEDGSPVGKQTPTRGFRGFIGDWMRNPQTSSLEEGDLNRRQRAVNRGNQWMQTAKQKAGEHGLRIREALKNSTAPLRSNAVGNRNPANSRRFDLYDDN